jgi:SAM-dependent methyltransferase
MLNLKKEADVLQAQEFKISACPICSSYVSQVYYMQDATTKIESKWYSCSCGVVFQNQHPTAVYDAKYRKKYEIYDKKTESAFQYPVRIYSPLIEELIYGRKVLIVGTPTFHQTEAFSTRGWIDYSIDKNSSYIPSDRRFVGDFETYEFPEKYNLIWIYHTLECFIDPIKALQKCKDLLVEDGILFMASPDTDFINTRSSSNFIHWKPEYNHIMWNRRSMAKHLDSLGFNVILNRQNYEHRFPAWDDFHILAQRKFF